MSNFFHNFIDFIKPLVSFVPFVLVGIGFYMIEPAYGFIAMGSMIWIDYFLPSKGP